MKYRVVMTNNDEAEAETLAAAMTAAETMEEEGDSAVLSVEVGGIDAWWAWQAVMEHTIEVAARRLADATR